MKTRFDEASAGDGLRWMLVDDNRDILDLLRFLISRSCDVEVECFCEPAVALAAFQAAPDSFALVLTDFEMPGMNGAELCDRVRMISPDIKVILTTGNDSISEAAAVRRGFCGLLRKPFCPRALDHALNTAGVVTAPKQNSVQSALLTMA